MQALSEKDGVIVVRLRAQPKASRNALSITPDGRIRAAVTAPASEGAANTALRSLVAKTLGVPKSAVALLSGERSREKTLGVRGVGLSEARKRLGME